MRCGTVIVPHFLFLKILEDRLFYAIIRYYIYYDLTHLVLDGLEIILSHCLGKYEVVVASVIDLRSDGILNFLSIKLDHCLGEDMRH